MRKVIFQILVTPDGFFEGPNGELDWHNMDQEFHEYAIDLLNMSTSFYLDERL